MKAFLLADVMAGRETIELAQRVDLDFDTVTLGATNIILAYSAGDFRGRRKVRQAKRNIEKKLENKYDVSVFGGTSGLYLTERAWKLLDKQVKSGTGLVWVEPAHIPEEYAIMLPLVELRNGRTSPPSEWKPTREHFITDALCWDILPKLSSRFYRKVNGEVIAINGKEPLVVVGNHGKGRVVVFNYLSGPATRHLPEKVLTKWLSYRAYTPYDPYERWFPKVRFPYWEEYFALLARAIVWAGGRDPQVTISSLRPRKRPFEPTEKPSVHIAVRNTGKPLRGLLKAGFFSITSQHQTWVKHKVKIPAGDSEVVLSAREPLPGGKGVCDVLIRGENDTALAWGSTSYEVKQSGRLDSISFESDLVKPARNYTVRSLSAVSRPKQPRESLSSTTTDDSSQKRLRSSAPPQRCYPSSLVPTVL